MSHAIPQGGNPCSYVKGNFNTTPSLTSPTRSSQKCFRSRLAANGRDQCHDDLPLSGLVLSWSPKVPRHDLDIATEEIGHVEMLATMIARSSPVEAQEEMAKNSLAGSMMGGARIEDAIVAGMNPQHLIVAGSGLRTADSIGNPWNAGYTIASGNLLADFRFNVTAESQGHCRCAGS